MAQTIDSRMIDGFRARLQEHPVYAAVADVHDLRCFMQHHVYSVWDFMSLIKFLQSQVAPAHYPWIPGADAEVQRFINELVLEEESDEHPTTGGFASHFVLYQSAMREIGADANAVSTFVETVDRDGIDTALREADIPAPSRAFTMETFGFIDPAAPHRAAAALALGREHIIPGMFRAILDRIGVGEDSAPIFHAYLKRHIHLDEDFHAPLSLRLLDALCGQDDRRIEEAVAAAEQAVNARLRFWDGVLDAIESRAAA